MTENRTAQTIAEGVMNARRAHGIGEARWSAIQKEFARSIAQAFDDDAGSETLIGAWLKDDVTKMTEGSFRFV